MAIFSKPVRLYCSCYELGHCWTPHCVQATTDVAQDVFSEAIKIYGALYLAVETGFRMLINRGIVRPIKNGEVMLFSVVSAVYLYLFRKKDGLPKSTLSVFKFLVGADENPDSTAKDANDNSTTSTTLSGTTTTLSTSTTTTTTTTTTSTTTGSDDSSRVRGSQLWVLGLLLRTPGVEKVVEILGPQWRRLVTCLKASPRHTSCPHSYGCLHYVLKGLCKMFGLGYVVQLLIKLVSSLPALRRRPSEISKVLWARDSLGLAAFLGLYSAVFRGVNCALRWWRQKDEALHGMLAGFLAGGTMYFYNSLTVALFSAAKLVELLYFKGIAAGRLPYIPYADFFIYAFSCAFVFHAAVLEPHALRPAYWKWLLRVTHNKFSQMNRRLLDVFGTESSKMFPNFWPKYDPRYTDMIHPPS